MAATKKAKKSDSRRRGFPEFSRLSDEERKVICNGCGSKGGWLNPPDFLFEASCDRHDFSYWRGHTEADRLRADYGFLQAMLRDAGRAPWHSRWWLWATARAYYRAVRWFGGRHFHYSDSPRTWADVEEARDARRDEQ